MWINNKIFKEDMEYITHTDFIDWGKLNNKTIFITGATGLIGYYLINALVYKNIKENSNIKILALVRDIKKAKLQFGEQLERNGNLEFICGDLNNIPNISEKIDYVVHGASPTTSKLFVEKPVEVIQSIVNGSQNILELAKLKNIKSMVYLSSMEVYGEYKMEEILTEDSILKINPNNIRDCYPLGKALVENISKAYFKEYKIPVNILRISQTIGLKENINLIKDRKIIQEIIYCILNKKDIVLATKGESKRTYIYIRDVITAILIILLSNKYGEIYNVANEKTYNSIYNMISNVIDNLASNEINLLIKEEKTNKYPKTNYLKLSSQKLKKLGWDTSINTVEMFDRIICSIMKERELK
ncbi:dTDP-glucose 4,6-dehydratase 2 [Megamonas hypermegale]|jgi:UDP-glucuronate decarboxylase|uniref:dTDP-glucose 4,6-dehydratase 2 n=1 Tax=Megamonas hypermegale TaxID=158847 RepID=A0A378NW52_9FIRM|nr:NAD-dependent epimerase/dehydratase family protein [Megamonas hypermegale]STY72095.1 dTDP-glucose 4,6-dehydratase 2 [Megamonas hypermegale]